MFGLFQRDQNRGWLSPPMVGGFYLDGKRLPFDVLHPFDLHTRIDPGHVNFEINTPAGNVLLGSFRAEREISARTC